mmetsp:Transcript_33031/g.99575  ORF Transcript_33031/g.99575 Transcript_33031/m.99575 type:complete len:778 (+) Transcript_33031:718-3051(+)
MSYKDFVKAKQKRDLDGDTSRALAVSLPGGVPWSTPPPKEPVADDAVAGPLQKMLTRHFLNARCDAPRLGFAWPPREKIGVELLPRVASAADCCRFRADDGGAEAPRSSPDADLPRLAVALLVRAAPPLVVDGFLRYHLATGFEKIWMYFDAPHEDAEAIAVAEACARATRGGVQVTRCTKKWWDKLRASDASRYVARGRRAAAEAEAAEVAGEDVTFFQKWRTERRMYEELDTGDVQARQAVVVDLALCAAQREGFDYCFHIDVDELFYCPRAADRRDARRHFARRVPAGADQVRFLNLEVVPPFQVNDWFSEADVFKVNRLHVRGRKGGLVEKFRAKRRADRRGRRERLGAAGDFALLKANSRDPAQCPDVLAPEPFLEITDRVGEARIATARILRDAGVEVPRPPPRADAPTRTLDEMLEDADADEDFAAAWARASKRAASRPPKPPKPPRSKGEEPKDDGFDPDRDPIECYFNAYENGKSACRLRPPPARPPLAGVHGFLPTDGAAAVGADSADEPLAPVILHFANCGFDYWKRKYEVLGDFPTPDADADPEDRPGMVNNMRSHVASRELVVKLAESGAPEERTAAGDLLTSFYNTWVAMDQHGEKPYLAAYGLLVKLDFPRRLLKEARDAGGWPACRRAAFVPPPTTFLGVLEEAPSPPRLARRTQWRVVHGPRVVSRSRPSVKAAPVHTYKKGELLWGARVTPNGFAAVADAHSEAGAYVLVDATHLGHGILLEKNESPELDAGACLDCFRAPCCCAVVASYEGWRRLPGM